MRKIILWIGISLDGYIEGPNQDISWHKVDAEFHQYANDELAEMSAFLQGRKTHALMASFWPGAAGKHPDNHQLVEFAGIWTHMPKHVYSRTWTDTGWNTTVHREVVKEEVEALKALPGNDMTVGGAELAAEFMKLGLIDEFRIFVHPVIVGNGKRLFEEGAPKQELALQETRQFGNGVVMLRYAKEA
jgi:dihydrofolate reductase